jgi:UrcA family protein
MTVPLPGKASRLGLQFAKIMLTAGIALAVLGTPQASAEAATVWIGGNSFVRFENINLESSRDRQLMLTQVEKAAADYCKSLTLRRPRCIERNVEKSMTDSSGLVRKAMTLALVERNGVAQAMR